MQFPLTCINFYYQEHNFIESYMYTNKIDTNIFSEIIIVCLSGQQKHIVTFIKFIIILSNLFHEYTNVQITQVVRINYN